MANNDFRRNCKPLHVQSPSGSSIRTRLIDIEHVNQPGTRNKNAVHIELFDKISIGRLKRVSHDELIDGDGGKYDIDMGIILCGRSPKNIKAFHSESSKQLKILLLCFGNVRLLVIIIFCEIIVGALALK